MDEKLGPKSSLKMSLTGLKNTIIFYVTLEAKLVSRGLIFKE